MERRCWSKNTAERLDPGAFRRRQYVDMWNVFCISNHSNNLSNVPSVHKSKRNQLHWCRLNQLKPVEINRIRQVGTDDESNSLGLRLGPVMTDEVNQPRTPLINWGQFSVPWTWPGYRFFTFALFHFLCLCTTGFEVCVQPVSKSWINLHKHVWNETVFAHACLHLQRVFYFMCTCAHAYEID